MKNLPTVSLIVTTYNRPKLLQKAMATVQAQDYPNLKEIIVTDDSTNNESELFICELAKKDPRIMYTKNTKYQRGPTGNKQNGFDLATGDFLAKLDDDDELLPTAISDLMKVHLEKGYRNIFANYRRMVNGKEVGTSLSYGGSREISYAEVLQGKYAGDYWGLFTRELFKGRKLKDDMWGGEGLLWWKFYQEEPTYHLDKVVAICHLNWGGNVSNQGFEQIDRTFLSYKYRIDLFGDDLMKYAPFQYRKYALLAAFFAMLLEDHASKMKYVKLAWNAKGVDMFTLLFSVFILVPLPKKLKIFLYQKAKQAYLKN